MWYSDITLLTMEQNESVSNESVQLVNELRVRGL